MGRGIKSKDKWKMTLKTIKDFEMISKKDLKQEAIKHIKKIRKDDRQRYKLINGKRIYKYTDNEVSLWIKYFFNISEEDLI